MDSSLRGAISGFIGELPVVENVSLPVVQNSVTAIFGPSGSGKTSLLRIIAGLWNGQTTRPDFDPALQIGYVAQRDFLFPWKTLSQNLLFPAKLKQVPSQIANRRVEELSDLFSIRGLLKRFPYEVSGGELQRALIVRAMVAGANLLLLDEPMNSLDVASRIALRRSLKSAAKIDNLAVILVTHELPDAISIADNISLCSGPPLRVESVLTRTSDNNFGDGARMFTAEQARLFIETELARFASIKGGLRAPQ
jgi:NitT/TauT family transport system ATP-binding protein